jgi:hypothetical protein
MSEESFDDLIKRGSIPELTFLDNIANNSVGYLFNKQSDVFYKSVSIQNGVYSKESFESELLPKLSEAGKTIYNNIKKTIPDDLKINITDDEGFNGKRKVLGNYNNDNNTITLFNHEFYEENREQTLLHELFHSAFNAFIDAPYSSLTSEQKSALTDIKFLFEEYHSKKGETEFDFKAAYPEEKTQLKEFIAESITNPNFLSSLDDINLDENESEPSINKWIQKFIDAVVKLFGLTEGSLATSLVSNVMFLMNTTKPIVHYNNSISSNKEVIDMSKIPEDVFQEQKKWSDIVDEHRKSMGDFKHYVDENGVEQSHYFDEGQRFEGVTSVIKTQFRGFQEEYDWITETANEEWDKRGFDPASKLKMIGFTKEVNKEEFVAQKKYEFETNMAVGNIIHYYFQKYIGVGNEEEIDAKIEELRVKYQLELIGFSWVESLYKHYKTQNHYTNRTLDYSEVPVKSNSLGIAGTIDHLILYDDGTFGVNDWKSGKSFENRFTDRMMKWGDVGGIDITNTPIHAAKAQVMLNALLFKIQHPEARFKSLTVQWVNKTSDSKAFRNNSNIEVEAYMKLIKGFIRDEHPKFFEENKDSNLFNPDHYMGVDNGITSEATKRNISPSQYEKLLETDLIKIIHKNNVSPRNIADKQGREGIKQREDLAETAYKILQLSAGNNQFDTRDDESQDRDLTVMKRWMASYEDIENPYLNEFKKVYDLRIDKARREISRKNIKFENLLRPIYKKWVASRGKSFSEKVFSSRLTQVSPWNTEGTGLFQFAWVTQIIDGYRKDVFVHPENHPEAWSKLTGNEQDLMMYFHDTLHGYWDPKDANSLMGRPISEDNFGKPITNYDKVKQKFGNIGNKVFEYQKGMTPRFHMGTKEIFDRFKFSGRTFQHIFDKYLTFRLENNWDEWQNEDEIIPVKGVENDYNTQDDMYTRNVEVIFDRMVRNLEMKDKMDYVYALGQGIRTYLKLKDNGDGAKMYQNTINFLEDKLLMDILNQVNQNSFSNKMVKGIEFKLPRVFVGSDKEKKDSGKAYDLKAISVHKILLAMKHLASASIMWMQPINGTRNGIFVSIVNAKDAVRNSIVERTLQGIDSNFIDFTVKDMAFAHKEVMKMYKDSMVGNVRKNKTYILAKKFDYLPDNFDWASTENELMSSSMSLVQESTMYMFHTLPEEYNALLIMVAQLNKMKMTDKEGNVKTIFESYSEPVDEGNGVYDSKWIGGSRGIKKRGNIEESLEGLDGLEVRKMKRVYQRMHGNYRRDERAAMEAYIFGQIFMQFRKYLPSIIIGSFGSLKTDQTLGYYKFTGETKDGEKVMKWQARMIEGRFRVFARFLSNSLAVMSGKRKDFFYDMETDQKAQVIDFSVTMTLMLTMMAAMAMMFDDDDEKDAFKLWLDVIIQNSTQHWNPMDQLRSIIQPPATFKKQFDLALGLSEMAAASYMLTIGESESAYTKNGKFKGWAATQKALPGAASIYNIRRFIDNTDFIGEGDNSLTVDLFRTR